MHQLKENQIPNIYKKIYIKNEKEKKINKKEIVIIKIIVVMIIII